MINVLTISFSLYCRRVFFRVISSVLSAKEAAATEISRNATKKKKKKKRKEKKGNASSWSKKEDTTEGKERIRS